MWLLGLLIVGALVVASRPLPRLPQHRARSRVLLAGLIASGRRHRTLESSPRHLA